MPFLLLVAHRNKQCSMSLSCKPWWMWKISYKEENEETRNKISSYAVKPERNAYHLIIFPRLSWYQKFCSSWLCQEEVATWLSHFEAKTTEQTIHTALVHCNWSMVSEIFLQHCKSYKIVMTLQLKLCNTFEYMYCNYSYATRGLPLRMDYYRNDLHIISFKFRNWSK